MEWLNGAPGVLSLAFGWFKRGKNRVVFGEMGQKHKKTLSAAPEMFLKTNTCEKTYARKTGNADRNGPLGRTVQGCSWEKQLLVIGSCSISDKRIKKNDGKCNRQRLKTLIIYGVLSKMSGCCLLVLLRQTRLFSVLPPCPGFGCGCRNVWHRCLSCRISIRIFP